MPVLPSTPLRRVSDKEVATFWTDGVVHLPSILPKIWLDYLADPIQAAVADRSSTTNLSALRADLMASNSDDHGGFFSGVDHWRHDPAFAAFATESPLPAIAGAVLDAEDIYLYEDSVLVKEPGTKESTVLHQDLGYFHLEGDRICTTWAPLDPVDDETGALSYLRGSHLDEQVHQPNWFVTDAPLPGTRGDPIPPTDDNDDRFITFDVQPGDVVVHHAATLHRAGPNRSVDRRRRAVSVRYCGDGVRHLLRPGAPTKPHHDVAANPVRSGDPVADHPGCPLVWKRA